MNNRNQAVRLVKEFQFTKREGVHTRKKGGDVILSPRPADWFSYLDEARQWLQSSS
jgi:virulence-associated protein VagC